MSKPIVAAVAALLLLGACVDRHDIDDPYAPPPDTCAAIDSERAALHETMELDDKAETAKRVAAGVGVAAGSIVGSPALALGAYFGQQLAGQDLYDTTPERERWRFLGLARMVRGEVQRGVMRLAGALRLDLTPGDCLQ